MGDRKDIATPNTFCDYPPELLRFYKEKEHAEQFIAGVIRLGSLCYYKCVEDATIRDSSEGTGLITAPVENVVTVKTNADFDLTELSEAPGNKSFNASYAGPLYILSCTDPKMADIAKLKRKWNRDYVVRITDPRQLGQQLTEKFSELDPKNPFSSSPILCCRVSYDKNQYRDTEPTTCELFELSVAQKSTEFSEECEVRLVVPTEMHKFNKNKDGKRVFCDHYCFDLGGPLNYANILDEKT